MNSALRALGVIAVFGIVGPPVGLAMLLLFTFAVSGERFAPINWSDFPYSVAEMGLPAAAAGVVFSAGFYWLSGRYVRMSQRPGRATLAAGAMALIFGLPFLEKLLIHSHFSANLGLIALLAGGTGALIGTALPAQMPVRKIGQGG